MSLISAQFYNMPGRYERVSVRERQRERERERERERIFCKDRYLLITIGAAER